MTPDLYGAWLTAGNNLQPVGTWLTHNWMWLAVAAAFPFAIWALVEAVGDDYRTCNDKRAARRITHGQPHPETPEPGTDVDLYLDCIAIYGDCDDLNRLRDAIHQRREEKS